MARIAGVNIPTAKRVPIALTYITGIGQASAYQICEAVGIDASRRVNELSDAEVLQIREHIDAGGDLSDAYYVDQSPYAHLDTYEELATKNAGRVYEQMEWE